LKDSRGSRVVTGEHGGDAVRCAGLSHPTRRRQQHKCDGHRRDFHAVPNGQQFVGRIEPEGSRVFPLIDRRLDPKNRTSITVCE
jgi:hypothetical protein